MFTLLLNRIFRRDLAIDRMSSRSGEERKFGELILAEEQIKAVRGAWSEVEKSAASAGVLLFKNIFDASPAAANLFSFVSASEVGDFEKLASNAALVKHALGVINTVSAVIWMLEKHETLTPILEDLGARHVLYEVSPEHYAVVGAAFLKTLRQQLGDKFTDDTQDAFASLWNNVIAVMMQSSDADAIERAKCDIAQGDCEAVDQDFLAHWTDKFVVDAAPDVVAD